MLRHIRLPTTVLAQNGSGLVSRTTLMPLGRTICWKPWPPYAVLNDASFLDGLDNRDQRAGMAKAGKVALIRDATFFSGLNDIPPTFGPSGRMRSLT